MPTYEYKCDECGAVIEVFHGFNDPGPKECECGATNSLQRLISAGSGIIFKGSGFYETDYKRSSASATPGKSNTDSSATDSKPAPAKSSPPKESPSSTPAKS